MLLVHQILLAEHFLDAEFPKLLLTWTGKLSPLGPFFSYLEVQEEGLVQVASEKMTVEDGLLLRSLGGLWRLLTGRIKWPLNHQGNGG